MFTFMKVSTFGIDGTLFNAFGLEFNVLRSMNAFLITIGVTFLIERILIGLSFLDNLDSL